jgi:hypothetical protein
VLINSGILQKKKWENAMTIDKFSWGYRRRATITDYLTMKDIAKVIATTVRSVTELSPFAKLAFSGR